MRKDRLLPGSIAPRIVSWRLPWQQGHGLDHRTLQSLYGWSIAATALLVSLYQFFSILPAGRALTRMLLGIVFVVAGGYGLVAGLSRVTGLLLRRMGFYQSQRELAALFMALGPWIVLATLAAVLTSRTWVTGLVGIVGLIALAYHMRRMIGVSLMQAFTIIAVEFVPLVALAIYWSWSMGWNFTPFY
ncbi:hypothetical protein BXT84_11520 [Sulfobacillus thermotolerans]|uniref:Yip1 domain-containing protein n=1 Tax=Sulfobacillus thermotolerans TaxID=338644 RepID=A0ABM6RST9_9FIRM|nr:hypothetical protein BXT84_11520 [Sulfobacillus thermotolerans]